MEDITPDREAIQQATLDNFTKNDMGNIHRVTFYERKPLIPDGLMWYVSIYLTIVIPIFISSFGVVTNAINLGIFFSLGLRDGMSIGLWVLSFSDFTVTLQTLGSSLCFLADILFPGTLIDPILVQYVSLLWSEDMMYLVSNWVTTFIALERCVCVMAPFKVKAIFTKSRSILVVVCIYGFHVATYIPIFASHKLSYEMTNVTTGEAKRVMVIQFTDNRATIHHTVDIIDGAVLPVIQQGMVIVSTICLIYGLKATSRIRHTNNQPDHSEDKKRSKLSQKETRLVKVMIFLALILTLCNIPRFVAVYATLLIPEMHIGALYENTYILLWALTTLFASLNASVNIFVYLLVNVSYRNMFLRIFCPIVEDKKQLTYTTESVTETSR